MNRARLSLRFFAPLCALATACACAPRVEAPNDLEGLARFFWAQGLEVSDADLDDAVGNTHAVLSDLLTDGAAKVGSLSRLDREDLETVGLADKNDPSGAPGLFLANRFLCDIDILDDVLASLRQTELHPGVYDAYERTYRDDDEGWLAADTGILTWDTEYAATPTATQYRATSRSRIRKVPRGAASVGPSLVQQTWLLDPATFDGSPDDHVFDQDYQAELYYQGDDSEVWHLYGLWRFMQLGIVSSYDDAFINFQLDGMIQWDEQTEAVCATWPELPGA